MSADSHVHFDPSQLPHHNLEIIVEQNSIDDAMDVHLGFLQVDHIYSIEVPISHSLGQNVQCSQNVFVRLLNVQASSEPDLDTFTFELFAHKERLMQEVAVLENPDTGKSMAVKFHARVLGKHKGTPALKNGIRSIGIRSEDESECSDWQGFE
ncbi:hypothetical protein BOX15_Mlig030935g1 [Macrostomum lignano]|uniref:Adipose-secreted signaling protein n=1 Tax=Macrostomum lignano TaxID=282301 RepID=A0A267FQ29_9PLAT|nr:hypothetical protein BOX15_Mlig030935g1 [Macrostomum lignano]